MVSISGLKFANARSFGNYGGCMQSRASLYLSNMVFDGCIYEGRDGFVAGWGGGLIVFGSTTRRPSVSMTDVTFSNNKALLGTVITETSAAGGFVLGGNSTAALSAVVLRNVTVNNNEAQNAGGARISGARSVAIVNSSFTANQATALGMGAWTGTVDGVFNGTVNVENSFLGRAVAGRTRNDAVYIFDPSKLTLTNTLIEDTGGPASAQCNTNGNRCNVDAKLDALANNGGPTQTMRLLPGSPAIDIGSNSTALTTDQRGAARMEGAATDIGAYETPSGSSAQCKLDMDADNLVTAMKEGLVLLRSMLGYTSAATTANTGITQGQWDAVRVNLNANCGTSLP